MRSGTFATKTEYQPHAGSFGAQGTWHSLLHSNCVLQYAGFGVWNVRGKNQRINPPSDWVIIEDAHQALITQDEASAIIAIREKHTALHAAETGARARSNGSRFLLSGGLFKCSRCGANMAGFRSQNGKGRNGFYYVCGSAEYRRSLGCGPGVFVDKAVIEQAVFTEIERSFEEWLDEKLFTREVNRILFQMEEHQTSDGSDVKARLSAANAKITNLRKALEDGLETWAGQMSDCGN